MVLGLILDRQPEAALSAAVRDYVTRPPPHELEQGQGQEGR